MMDLGGGGPEGAGRVIHRASPLRELLASPPPRRAGNGAFIMHEHDVLENRTKVQCVISAVEKDHPKDLKRPLTREFLEDTLRDWLDETKRPSEIAHAFQAYSAVRRDRCQRVIDSSRGTGLIFCGQDPEAGLEPNKMMGLLAPRWGFIGGIDFDSYKEEALGRMKQLQGQGD